jgi:hypothetical protein
MNARSQRVQLICLWAGAAAIVALGLFPPWVVGSQTPQEVVRRPFGHHFIGYRGPGEILAIDYGHLCLEWFLIGLIVGTVLVSFWLDKGRGKNG